MSSPAVANYSSSDRVRGALGFTSRDVPDEFISSRRLEDEVLSELYNWLPTHAADYSTWSGTGATAEFSNNARLLRTYTTYLSAYFLCSGIEMLAQRSVTDSKAGMERFSGVNLSRLREKMLGMAEGSKSKLAETLSIPIVVSSSPSLFSGVSPAFDPVTGS